MTRFDIVSKLLELFPTMKIQEVDILVKEIFCYLSDQLSKGNRVEIRGFGCYSVKTREPGLIRNASKGISMSVGKRNVIYFRPGRTLKERVNSNISLPN